MAKLGEYLLFQILALGHIRLSWPAVPFAKDHRCAFYEFRLFSPIALPFLATKIYLFYWFFSIFKFLARISPLQINLGSWGGADWNLISIFSRGRGSCRCDFWRFQLFTSISASNPITIRENADLLHENQVEKATYCDAFFEVGGGGRGEEYFSKFYFV